MSEEIKSTLMENENVMPVITIDDGSIDIPIQNQFGEKIGVFRFNPSDINIVNRYNEVADQFGEIVKPLINANISSEGEGEDDESIHLLNEAGDKMVDLMDYVLNGNSREAFFGKTHIFAPVGGMFYCEKVYEAVGAFISQRFSAEVKRVNNRMNQHTHGYRTGKHAKGRK
jgi:hypothetical protein